MTYESHESTGITDQLEAIVAKAEVDITVEEILAESAQLAVPNTAAIADLMRRYLDRFSDEEIKNLLWDLKPLGNSLERTTDDFGRGLRNYCHMVWGLEGTRWYFTEGDGDIDETAENLQKDIEFTDVIYEIEPIVAAIEANDSLTGQVEQASELKAKMMDLIERFQIKPLRPDGRDYEGNVSWHSLVYARQIETPANSSSVDDIFKDVVRLVERVSLRYAIKCELETVERMPNSAFEQLRQQYGSKAAQLLRLKGYAEQIDRQRGQLERVIRIPEFQVVDIEVYEKWLAGEDIDDALRPLYDWASQLKTYGEDRPSDYIVRSSAVNSEDGENLTGAGIYQSIDVAAGSSYEAFKAAVEAVYRSVESETAEAYRRENGVFDERMGLVIQRLANTVQSDRPIGYANSVMPGQPSLMELVFQGEYSSLTNRNFVRRAEMDRYLGMVGSDSDRTHPAHHFKPDLHKVMSSRILDEAQLVMVIEKLLDKLVQVEMVRDWPDLSVVQVRPLPPKFLEAYEPVEFPDEKEVYRSSALGIGDLELDRLPSKADNTDKKGLVVFNTNHFWTMSSDQSYRLPKEGAVLILDDAGLSGHIQTLCAERGLICLFGGQYDEYGYLVENVQGEHFRVVADGLEGRIYAAEPDDDLTKA